MTSKNLGRGLSAFLESKNPEPESSSNTVIRLDKISKNPYQPRQTFDEENLRALADSIRRRGVLQPIIVVKRDDGSGEYQLVAGERRLRASELAGLTEIPAIIADLKKDEQLEIAILENIQRENLNPVEEAEAYKRLLDEFNYTQEALSEVLGKSRSQVTNILRLLGLPSEVKKMLREGKISFGHARALIGAENAVELAWKIVEEDLSVRAVEELKRQQKNDPDEGSNTDSSEDAFSGNFPEAQNDIKNVAMQLSNLIGMQTDVKMKKHGGIIQITFKNLDQLDYLLQRLSNNRQVSLTN